MSQREEPAVATHWITAAARPVKELAPAERQQLYHLMSSHFENVDSAQFFADLDEKRSVIIVTDPTTQRIVGFATLTVLETTLGGSRIAAIFAGDTVLEPAYWGHHAWIRTWSGMRSNWPSPPTARPCTSCCLRRRIAATGFCPASFASIFLIQRERSRRSAPTSRCAGTLEVSAGV